MLALSQEEFSLDGGIFGWLGSIPAYELTIPQTFRNKTIALKIVMQVESDTIENEESYIAFLAK